MKYTKEHLELAYNIRDLREMLSNLGGVPSTKSKRELIQSILDIQSGIIPSPKVKGRKSNREKFKEKDFDYEYLEDEFDTICVKNKYIDNDYVGSYDGAFKVSGTLEKLDSCDNGFLRGHNFKISGESDVYVSPATIRAFNLKCGDFVEGTATSGRDSGAPSLKTVNYLNGKEYDGEKRVNFSDFEPIFPDERITLERNGDLTLRAIDLLSPIGKGQRALIVSPPKAGKTTLIKKIATSISENYKDAYLIVALIGERPEEVTDFKRSVSCELIYSTFDDKVKNHVRIAKLAIEKAKRQAEMGKDVVVLLDSITRLVRVYNEIIPSSGKTLSGGLDPNSFQEPKSLFGSARNFEGKGSLTIIATALVETGSKMDDVVYEEFKGTGNSEIYLSRELSERRIFPAIDLYRSGTRREDLLLSEEELAVSYDLRRKLDKTKDAELKVLDILSSFNSNQELIKNYGKNL